MKKILIAIAVSTLFAGQVSATGHKPPKQEKGNTVAAAASSSAAIAEAAAVASGGKASANAKGGAGGSASGGTAVVSIAPMNFTFAVPTEAGPNTSFVQHDYSGMPRQAPAQGNNYISTSNSCDGASGLGVVFPGGGVNFSSTALRMMCEGRLNSQAHKALGDEDKARRVMRVVDEYACTQDATWAKIAREEGICKPDTTPPATSTNPAFNSAG